MSHNIYTASMTMKTKKILLIVLGILLTAAAINFFAGTTLVINGSRINGLWKYAAAYFALVLLAALFIIVIPSVFILTALLGVCFLILAVLFFPILPITLLLLPGMVFIGIVYLVYRSAGKKKQKNETGAV